MPSFKKLEPFYLDRLNKKYKNLDKRFQQKKIAPEQYQVALWKMIKENEKQINMDAVKASN